MKFNLINYVVETVGRRDYVLGRQELFRGLALPPLQLVQHAPRLLPRHGGEPE